MPCLFALGAAFAPRLTFLILWLFTPLINRAFDGWFLPLLGFIFLPFTALIYALVVVQLGPTSVWGWLAVILALLMDLRGYFDAYVNRNRLPTYPMG
jgi:hypothetical protein